MISKKMQEAINAQINAELWSAYLYLSMSMDAADKGFKGSAHWFVHQFKEEQGHAEKLAGYLQSQNAKVVLAPIARPNGRRSWRCSRTRSPTNRR